MVIEDAANFWIEAGAMSGPPAHRHQIEFSNDLVQFFDEEARESEVVAVRFPGGPVLWRPLTYRGTDYGQWTNIWRLGLPTPRMGGPQYAGKAIKFERIASGPPVIYEITVADGNSPEVTQWRSNSSALGQAGVTGGPVGREYGFW